jgi:hypothetical protein
MNPSIQVDTGRVPELLAQFAREAGRELGPLIADESRLFFEAAMKMTPPKTASQGKKAVERSVHNSFTPIMADDIGSPALRRLLEADDLSGANAFMLELGEPGQFFELKKAMHKSDRSKRTGRVHGHRGRYLFGPARNRQLVEYIKMRQARVGTFRAVYAGIVDEINRHSKIKSRIPNWVSKQTSRAEYLRRGLTVRLAPEEKNPSVSAIFIAHPQSQKGFNRAIKSREASLRKKIRLAIADRVNRTNSLMR